MLANVMIWELSVILYLMFFFLYLNADSRVQRTNASCWAESYYRYPTR